MLSEIKKWFKVRRLMRCIKWHEEMCLGYARAWFEDRSNNTAQEEALFHRSENKRLYKIIEEL